MEEDIDPLQLPAVMKHFNLSGSVHRIELNFDVSGDNFYLMDIYEKASNTLLKRIPISNIFFIDMAVAGEKLALAIYGEKMGGWYGNIEDILDPDFSESSFIEGTRTDIFRCETNGENIVFAYMHKKALLTFLPDGTEKISECGEGCGFKEIFFENNKFLAISGFSPFIAPESEEEITGENTAIAVSEDGLTWTVSTNSNNPAIYVSHEMIYPNIYKRLIFRNGTYILTSALEDYTLEDDNYRGGRIYKSTNGLDWEKIEIGNYFASGFGVNENNEDIFFLTNFSNTEMEHTSIYTASLAKISFEDGIKIIQYGEFSVSQAEANEKFPELVFGAHSPLKYGNKYFTIMTPYLFSLSYASEGSIHDIFVESKLNETADFFHSVFKNNASIIYTNDGILLISYETDGSTHYEIIDILDGSEKLDAGNFNIENISVISKSFDEGVTFVNEMQGEPKIFTEEVSDEELSEAALDMYGLPHNIVLDDGRIFSLSGEVDAESGETRLVESLSESDGTVIWSEDLTDGFQGESEGIIPFKMVRGKKHVAMLLAPGEANRMALSIFPIERLETILYLKEISNAALENISVTSISSDGNTIVVTRANNMGSLSYINEEGILLEAIISGNTPLNFAAAKFIPETSKFIAVGGINAFIEGEDPGSVDDFLALFGSAVSDDGINWTSRTSRDGTSPAWYSFYDMPYKLPIGYCNGKYIIMGGYSISLKLISEDGLNWEELPAFGEGDISISDVVENGASFDSISYVRPAIVGNKFYSAAAFVDRGNILSLIIGEVKDDGTVEVSVSKPTEVDDEITMSILYSNVYTLGEFASIRNNSLLVPVGVMEQHVFINIEELNGETPSALTKAFKKGKREKAFNTEKFTVDNALFKSHNIVADSIVNQGDLLDTIPRATSSAGYFFKPAIGAFIECELEDRNVAYILEGEWSDDTKYVKLNKTENLNSSLSYEFVVDLSQRYSEGNFASDGTFRMIHFKKDGKDFLFILVSKREATNSVDPDALPYAYIVEIGNETNFRIVELSNIDGMPENDKYMWADAAYGNGAIVLINYDDDALLYSLDGGDSWTFKPKNRNKFDVLSGLNIEVRKASDRTPVDYNTEPGLNTEKYEFKSESSSNNWDRLILFAGYGRITFWNDKFILFPIRNIPEDLGAEITGISGVIPFEAGRASIEGINEAECPNYIEWSNRAIAAFASFYKTDDYIIIAGLALGDVISSGDSERINIAITTDGINWKEPANEKEDFVFTSPNGNKGFPVFPFPAPKERIDDNKILFSYMFEDSQTSAPIVRMFLYDKDENRFVHDGIADLPSTAGEIFFSVVLLLAFDLGFSSPFSFVTETGELIYILLSSDDNVVFFKVKELSDDEFEELLIGKVTLAPGTLTSQVVEFRENYFMLCFTMSVGTPTISLLRSKNMQEWEVISLMPFPGGFSFDGDDMEIYIDDTYIYTLLGSSLYSARHTNEKSLKWNNLGTFENFSCKLGGGYLCAFSTTDSKYSCYKLSRGDKLLRHDGNGSFDSGALGSGYFNGLFIRFPSSEESLNRRISTLNPENGLLEFGTDLSGIEYDLLNIMVPLPLRACANNSVLVAGTLTNTENYSHFITRDGKNFIELPGVAIASGYNPINKSLYVLEISLPLYEPKLREYKADGSSAEIRLYMVNDFAKMQEFTTSILLNTTSLAASGEEEIIFNSLIAGSTYFKKMKHLKTNRELSTLRFRPKIRYKGAEEQAFIEHDGDGFLWLSEGDFSNIINEYGYTCINLPEGFILISDYLVFNKKKFYKITGDTEHIAKVIFRDIFGNEIESRIERIEDGVIVYTPECFDILPTSFAWDMVSFKIQISETEKLPIIQIF